MKGDFTRNTFRKARHYRKVNMQQGRVQVDADWNEQNDIQFHYEQSYTRDVIGKNGTPSENSGFEILPNFEFGWNQVNVDAGVTESLRQFLRDNFGLYWIENQQFTKAVDVLTVKGGECIATITRDAANNKAVLAIDGSDAYEFLLDAATTTVYSRGYIIGAGEHGSAGHYYVDGILCENEHPVEATLQPDLQMDEAVEFILEAEEGEEAVPSPAMPANDKHHLAYIDVWERHVTHLEDSYILEKALGDVDTATRTRIAWQIKLLDVESHYSEDGACGLWESAIAEIDKPTSGKMKARASPSPEVKSHCSPYETAGYQKLENQLYRIEVHEPGNLASATFKWSRDNGTVVSRVTEFKHDDNQIVIEKRGRDKFLDFAKDQWVEVTDDLHEDLGIPGTFVKLAGVEDTTLEYDPATVHGKPILLSNYMSNPKVRRWESRTGEKAASTEPQAVQEGALITPATPKTDGYVELEEGVQIQLSGDYYRTGDYWLVPARTRTGDVEWPQVIEGASGEPLAMPPLGMVHHYAPLAVVQRGTDGRFKIVQDSRTFFSSLTDLVEMRYAGGDGQEALPGAFLPDPLRVAVTLGRTHMDDTPLQGCRVRFSIVSPAGTAELESPDDEDPAKLVAVVVVKDGIAECRWKLNPGTLEHRVRAELIDECGDPFEGVPPVYFSASLRFFFYHVQGDGQEALPESTVDVKAAIKLADPTARTAFRVTFTSSSGALVPASVTPAADGSAASEWTLASAPNVQKATAVLQFADGSATDVPPVHFNVGLLKGSIANTGIAVLKLPIEFGTPLIFGPFDHKLQGLTAPPSVYLGVPMPRKRGDVSDEKNSEVVVIMEDFPGFSMLFKPILVTTTQFYILIARSKERDVAGSYAALIKFLQSVTKKVGTSGTIGTRRAAGARGTGSDSISRVEAAELSALGLAAAREFRALDISSLAAGGVTTTTDAATDARPGTTTSPTTTTSAAAAAIPQQLKLRWWAVPGEDTGEQTSGPVNLGKLPTIAFDKNSYTMGERVTVTAVNPLLPEDQEAKTINVLITATKAPEGVVLKLKETGMNTNVFEGEFALADGTQSGTIIKIGNKTHTIPKLKVRGQFHAIYEYEPGKTVSDTAILESRIG